MTEIVGVKFKGVGKVYYFDPNGIKVEKGQKVIVETAQGTECGDITIENREINDESIVQPLKKVLRIATSRDMEVIAENVKKEKAAFEICQKKIEAHKLEMKLTSVEYSFGQKFCFISPLTDGLISVNLLKIWQVNFTQELNFVKSVFVMRRRCLAVLVFAVSSSVVIDFWTIFTLFLLKWRKSKAYLLNR